MKSKLRSIEKENVFSLFSDIDQILKQKQKKIHITVVGGLAIILQGFRKRATLDIDIASGSDSKLFSDICKELNIPVDIITMTSTVDLTNTTKVNQYSGEYLIVDTVLAEDLIRMKLERFYKHDPEDIYAIITKTQMTYDPFKSLVQNMLIDFVGNPQGLILSATQVVERLYTQHLIDFEQTINKL